MEFILLQKTYKTNIIVLSRLFVYNACLEFYYYPGYNNTHPLSITTDNMQGRSGARAFPVQFNENQMEK